jgi:Cysteine rich repeat
MTPSHRCVYVALIVVVFAGAILPQPVSAQGPACADDVKQFCQGVQPGGGRIVQCLKTHATDLSAACKDRPQAAQSRSQEAQTRAQAIHQACQSDVATLCHDVGSGSGHLLQCLQQHTADLSAECQAVLSPVKPGGTPSQ